MKNVYPETPCNSSPAGDPASCLNVSGTGRYCMYLRKSRADQEAELHGEGETLARHKAMLYSLAGRLNITVQKIYEEIQSGESISARPVMQSLLYDVETGKWDGVLVAEVERLARGDTKDQGYVAEAFKYTGTTIITPQKTYDPGNEADEEYFEFGLFMSRREYKTINRRLQNGRRASVAEGKYAGNIPPYGYRRVKLEQDKGFTLEPIPEQASIVNLIFTLYVHGEVTPDKTRIYPGAARIATRLNQLQVPAPKSGEWVYSTILGILKNPVYIGKLRWGHRKVRKHPVQGKLVKSRPVSGDYLLAEGIHSPLIAKDLFYQAQNRLLSGRSPLPSCHTMQNPLCGLIRCSLCGRHMTRRKCPGSPDLLICPYPSCPTVGSPLYLVEQQLFKGLDIWLPDVLLRPDICPASNPSPALASSSQILLHSRQTEVKRLLKQKHLLCDLLEQGIYTPSLYTERSRLLDTRLDQLYHVIEELTKEASQWDICPAASIPLPASVTIPQACSLLHNAQRKNEILRELIDHIVYTKTRKNKRGEGQLPKFKLEIYPKIPPVNS